jgi:single-strand DNA-binding protein
MTVNQVILVGNLGKDPEILRTTSGTRYARFSMATSESWKDKNSGERKERTEWHRVVVWNEGLVDVLEKYVKKGHKIYVQGKVETRSWEDNTGQKRYATEVVVQGFSHFIKLLGAPTGGRGDPDGPVASGQSYMRDDDRVPDHNKSDFDYAAEAEKRGFNDEIPF